MSREDHDLDMNFNFREGRHLTDEEIAARDNGARAMKQKTVEQRIAHHVEATQRYFDADDDDEFAENQRIDLTILVQQARREALQEVGDKLDEEDYQHIRGEFERYFPEMVSDSEGQTE